MLVAYFKAGNLLQYPGKNIKIGKAVLRGVKVTLVASVKTQLSPSKLRVTIWDYMQIEEGVSREELAVFSESIVDGWIIQAISIVIIYTIRFLSHSQFESKSTFIYRLV